MIKDNTEIRVRYSDTDQMGFVYYGNYPKFLEIGRVELLRNFGVSYKNLEKKGVALPVVNLNIDYIHPAKYDDLLNLTTIISTTPSRKIEFNYEIHNQENKLICKAYTALVFIDIKTMKPMRCPQFIIDKLEGLS